MLKIKLEDKKKVKFKGNNVVIELFNSFLKFKKIVIFI
jgi:hypothetical protein